MKLRVYKENKIRDKKVTIRFSESEHNKLKELAIQRQEYPAVLVHSVIMKYLEVNK